MSSIPIMSNIFFLLTLAVIVLETTKHMFYDSMLQRQMDKKQTSFMLQNVSPVCKSTGSLYLCVKGKSL